MLDLRGREAADRLIGPVARLLVRAGVRPSGITVVGLAVTVVGAVVVAGGRPLPGGVLILAGSALDALDGAVARTVGSASPRGAVLDSVADRVGETAMWAGLAYHLGGDPVGVALCTVALGTSFLISYLRSKAEALGHSGRGGLMARPERVVVFSAGLIFGLVEPMLWAMVALTGLTALQRMASLWRRLPE